MRKDLWPQSWQGQRETTAGSLTQSLSFIPRHHSSLLPLPLATVGLGNKSSWAGKGVNACADGSIVVPPRFCLLFVPQFPHPGQSHLPVH